MKARSFKRFLRGLVATVGAATAIYGANYLLDTPALDSALGVGFSAVVAGALLALGKYVRQKYGVDFTP